MSQFNYKKINTIISEDTSDTDVNNFVSISVENDACSTQINIAHPFSSTVVSEPFLNVHFSVFRQPFFHKLTSLTDFHKYDIILKPTENFIFPADKNKRPLVRNWVREFPWVG